jgi:hypothetical protein
MDKLYDSRPSNGCFCNSQVQGFGIAATFKGYKRKASLVTSRSCRVEVGGGGVQEHVLQPYDKSIPLCLCTCTDIQSLQHETRGRLGDVCFCGTVGRSGKLRNRGMSRPGKYSYVYIN